MFVNLSYQHKQHFNGKFWVQNLNLIESGVSNILHKVTNISEGNWSSQKSSLGAESSNLQFLIERENGIKLLKQILITEST